MSYLHQQIFRLCQQIFKAFSIGEDFSALDLHVERLLKKRSGDGSGESGGNVGVHGSVQLGFLQQRIPNGEQAVGTIRSEMDQSILF
jgi:hypothetical protein